MYITNVFSSLLTHRSCGMFYAKSRVEWKLLDQVNIALGNGLSPVRPQALPKHADILSIAQPGTNLNFEVNNDIWKKT